MPLGVFPYLMLKYLLHLLHLLVFRHLKSLEYVDSSPIKTIIVSDLENMNITHEPITVAYYLNPNETNFHFI